MINPLNFLESQLSERYFIDEKGRLVAIGYASFSCGIVKGVEFISSETGRYLDYFRFVIGGVE